MALSAISVRETAAEFQEWVMDFLAAAWEIFLPFLPSIISVATLWGAMFFFSGWRVQPVSALRSFTAMTFAALVGVLAMMVWALEECEKEWGCAGVILSLLGFGLAATIPIARVHPGTIPVALVSLIVLDLYMVRMHHKDRNAYTYATRREICFAIACFVLPLFSSLVALRFFTKML